MYGFTNMWQFVDFTTYTTDREKGNFVIFIVRVINIHHKQNNQTCCVISKASGYLFVL